MRRLLTLSLAAVAAYACSSEPSNAPVDGEGGDGGPVETDEWDDRLAERVVDYSAALRIAALRLTGDLPTLTEIKAVAEASEADKPQVYADLVRAYLEDTRFDRQMIRFWRDTFKMSGGELESAPVFAAQLADEGRPMTELLTASSGTCPTYDGATNTFVAADCQNGAPATAGLLTHPGVHSHFYSSMAFRRTRWVQEIFACTAFPAETAEPVDVGGLALYASPWPFESISGAANGGLVDFRDVKAVACANCHSTMNHIAPLLAYFDENGQATAGISVTVPVEGTPAARLEDWLPTGEPTAWRYGVPAADLPALGRAMAADPLIPECMVARAWNWALGKGDIVDTLAVVPTEVIATQIDAFTSGGFNYKDALFRIFTSDDFVRF